MFRSAADHKQVLQNTGHVSSRERTAHFDRQAFPRVLVDHGQQLQRATIFGPIGREVVGLDMIDPLRSMADAAVLTAAVKPSSTVLFSWDLRVLVLPKPMHPRVVDLQAGGNNCPVDERTTETGTTPSETAHLSQKMRCAKAGEGGGATERV
jgi:hypothetical protein